MSDTRRKTPPMMAAKTAAAEVIRVLGRGLLQRILRNLLFPSVDGADSGGVGPLDSVICHRPWVEWAWAAFMNRFLKNRNQRLDESRIL